MKPSDLISIVTVNYNGIRDTEELIYSLRKHVSLLYEVIVVDNGSVVNEALELQCLFPEVVIVRSERNLGFAGGNNLGIGVAKGEYILLLNNDTIVEEDTFRYLVDRLASDPLAGAVSPKIKFAFSPFHIQFAGYEPLSRVTLRNDLIGFDCPDRGDYDSACRTPYTHGAAMMVRRDVVQKTGLMPEVYFLYYEELDWCTQMADLGYHFWYEPRCTVFHKESRSTGQGSALRTFYLTRNRLLYGWRNRRGVERWLSLFYQLLISAPKNGLFFLLKSRFDLFWAVCRGCMCFFLLGDKMQKY